MKKILRYLFPALLFCSTFQLIQAQNILSPDQNPDYAVSRNKYMKLADSINAWHSTTFQETYNSIDYLEDRREARQERKAFLRQLRLERASNNWSYYPASNYSSFPYYNDRHYRNYYPGRGNYYRFRNHDYLWNSLPLAIALGLLFR